MLPLYIETRIYNIADEIANRIDLTEETFTLDELNQELVKNDIYGYSFFNNSNKELALNFLLNLLQNDDIDFVVAQ